MDKKYKILSSLFLITLIFLAFTPPLNSPAGGWYQQFMPNIGNLTISDITFIDSLVGYAVTNYQALNDTDYILKTSNGGDNWIIIRTDAQQFAGFNKIVFLNKDTGFTCGVSNFPTKTSIQKTTNGGQNWINIPPPDVSATYYDISILSNDTFWVADIDGLTGGVYRTINGGVNWDRQYNGNNPNKIYMFDRNLGFISPPTMGALYRTTNSGVNWAQVPGTDGFSDMCFQDNMTGWKANGYVRKTTDGGLTWIQQTIPSGGIILSNAVNKIALIKKDTLWGVGGSVFYGSGQFRGTLVRTINGGTNWLFQVPDTSIHLDYYRHIVFVNKNCGWAYRSFEGGIHTTTGGDPIWYTGVQQINSEIPEQFKLYQNYPNPFNPRTVIKYEVRSQKSEVRLVIYDINGREVTTLVNEFQNAGTYEVDYSGNELSSGVYFYKITITTRKEVFIDTKKMILIK